MTDLLSAEARARQREKLRRATEDGEWLYRKRMRGGLTVADDHRLSGILSLDLPDALTALDALSVALDLKTKALAACAGVQLLTEQRAEDAERERDEWQRTSLETARALSRALGPYRDVDDLVAAREAAEARVAALREALQSVQALVDEQAEDGALWAVYPFGGQPVAEAYLQQELRRLHAAVERAALAAAEPKESE